MGAADQQAGVLGLQIGGGQLGHAGLGPQQIEPLSRPGHPGHEALGKADAGDPALQRTAQNFGGVGDAHPVGQHQVGPQQSPPEGRVLLCRQQELRVGGDGVVKPLRLHQGLSPPRRFLRGQVVKADPQYFRPHSAPPPNV